VLERLNNVPTTGADKPVTPVLISKIELGD